MAEYIDKKYLDRKFQIDMMCIRGGTMFDSKKIIDSLPIADVIERAEYEKLKKENTDLKIKYADAEKRFCNAMDKNAKLRSKIDKARAEILKNIYKYSGSGNEVTQAYCDGFKDSLEIVVRNMGE